MFESNRTQNVYNIRTQEWETIPKPVYFTSSRRVAKTYTDPMQAFDWRNADPGIITKEFFPHRERTWHINADGNNFAGIPEEFVVENLPEDEKQKYYDLKPSYVHTKDRGLRAEEISILAHKLGYQNVLFHRLVDDYNAKGKPSTVLMRFPD